MEHLQDKTVVLHFAGWARLLNFASNITMITIISLVLEQGGESNLS